MLTKFTVAVALPPSVTEHETDLPEEPTYDQLRPIFHKHLGAGLLVERVRVFKDLHRILDARARVEQEDITDMFVVEDGMYREPRDGFVVNEYATRLYQNVTQHAHGTLIAKARHAGKKSSTFIIGPAIIFARPVWF